MKRLDYINKRLRQKHEAKSYFNKVDEAIFKYYQVFVKQIKHLSLEHQLSDFYHPLEGQKNGELLFVMGDTYQTTYALLSSTIKLIDHLWTGS